MSRFWLLILFSLIAVTLLKWGTFLVAAVSYLLISNQISNLNAQAKTTAVKLPDGSRLTSMKDFERFTDRNHPYFWPPKSPVAWGGRGGIPKRGDLSDWDLLGNDDY